MDDKFANMAVCYNARLDDTCDAAVGSAGELVGFVAALPQPGVKEEGRSHDASRVCFREHRLVVLPRFQGLGIGPCVSECLASHMLRAHRRRYICRTAHPALGRWREKSALWEGTSTNGVAFTETTCYNPANYKKAKVEKPRACFSHSYVGTPEERALVREQHRELDAREARAATAAAGAPAADKAAGANAAEAAAAAASSAVGPSGDSAPRLPPPRPAASGKRKSKHGEGNVKISAFFTAKSPPPPAGDAP